MNLNDYKQILKETILNEYPIYYISKIIKSLEKNNLIFNDKRKNNKKKLPDISNISDKRKKLDSLFNKLDCLIKEIEDFEYTRAYRYCAIFKINKLDNKNIIKKLNSISAINMYKKVDNFNDILSPFAINPTCKYDDNIIYFKFNFELNDKENKKIKYPVLAVIHRKLSILEIRLDTVSFKYKDSENFYKDKIRSVKAWFSSILNLNLTNIDFQAVIKYMKDYKDKDVSIVALKMRRDGMMAYLDSSSNEYLMIPILGELKNFMKDKDNLFNSNKETKSLQEELNNFIYEIEETSDLPSVKILWDDRKIRLLATHGYKEEDYTLFKYSDELGDEEKMMYVTKYFVQCERELTKKMYT